MAPQPLTLASRLARLVAEGNTLTHEVSLDGVLQRVCDLARDLIGARYAAMGLLSPDGTTLQNFFTSGLSETERVRIGALPRGKGILGLVIKEGRVVRLPDLADHPASVGFPANHPPMRSFLGAPVVGRVGVLGDLYLTEKSGEPEFSAEDEHVAVLLATMAAAAIENARQHEESARLMGEVQKLHRTRERFFATVNHELRNALAAVHGWAEMLVRKKDPATVPRAAFEVLDSAQQAIGLINDLLDLSRLDEDRLRPVFQPTQLEAMIRQALRRVTPAMEERDIRFTLSIAPEIDSCVTDANRVEQILINVLRNAVRHSPEGGRITVEVSSGDSTVILLVGDEGPGVPPDQIERIFDVYETRAFEEREGVGLGLPLSRRLARLLGGDLVAEHRIGVGGRFRLELPRSDPNMNDPSQ